MKADGSALDVITFSGNGEPTGHPDFLGIVEDTIRLRNNYYPNAKVSVLTNSTLAIRPDVHRALMLVDNNIMKLDTVDPIYINNVDRPVSPAYDVEQIIKEMQSFNGHVIIQTIFMNGTDDLGHDVSNTSDRFVEPWLAVVRQIRPSEVMIYTMTAKLHARHCARPRTKNLTQSATVWLLRASIALLHTRSILNAMADWSFGR